ncbi:hypothetical protein ACLK1T_02425 [Escherichia coli]
MTGDEYNAKNAIFTVSEAMEHSPICRPDCMYLRIKKMFICGFVH